MKSQRRYPWMIMLFSMLPGLAAGVILGCQLWAAFVPSDRVPPEAEPNFRLMAEAWNTIQRFYVDRPSVKAQRLTYGAISGMVSSLGDTGHSRFLSPEMVKQEHNFTKGKLEGIGAEVQMKNNQLVIVTPIDGSPAQKAGLQPGEIILKVNGEEISGLPLEQAVGRILGKPGTQISLVILNPETGRTREISLTRASITLQNVLWRRLPDTSVAHVRIATFSEGVTQKLRKDLRQIQREGITGIILDLRNNPGGLFEESIDTASQFLDRGNVVLEKDAQGKITPVTVKPGGVAVAISMAALINGGTGSAAEIVAGALKDGRRAKLVGEKTFGTGTVLQRFSLSDGSALLIATKEWLTPDGQVIWHRGVLPDVAVSLPPEVTPLFPEAEKELTVLKLRGSGDVQLLRALDLVLHPSPGS